jgi:drug/metabolite transporter (DMT)-like permease
MRLKHPTTIGLLGVLGVWIISAVSFSWVTKLDDFTAEEIIFWRGMVTLFGACIFYRKDLGKPDKFMPGYALGIAFAALGAYKSIRCWGVNPTIIIFAMTPAVNILFALVLKQRIPKFALLGFAVMTIGISLSLRPDQWHVGLNSNGLMWAIVGTLGCGIGNHCLGMTRDNGHTQLAFMGTGMAVLCLGDMVVEGGGIPLFQIRPVNCLYMAIFAISVGWFYLQAYILGFKHLNKIVASVLLQGETPSVIFVAGIFHDEKMLPLQWTGVAVVLGGVILTKFDASKKD